MIRKSSTMKDICDAKRRKLNYGDKRTINDMPTDTQGALSYISSIFPREKFKNGLPPIVMRHQIYAFMKCRTEVDKELNELRKNGEIRLFKLGDRDDQVGIVSTKAYKDYVESNCRNNLTVGNFLKVVVSVCPDIGYSNSVLMKDYGLQEEDIVELVQNGVLTCRRDVGCYWLSIPQVGDFMKTFYYGRRAVLQYVRRTKYKEILQNELEQRKLPRKALLGILYHVYDIIGSDAVTCIDTSTGVVLRLQPELVR